MAQRDLPLVALFGRTNVGKSTIFNRLVDQGKSLVFEREGVTRDPIKGYTSWQGRSFRLVDTGGVSLRKTDDPILSRAREQALAVLDEAVAVLFVCDCSVGLLPEDRELARVLHRSGKPIMLVANKADVRGAQEQLHEFQQLGFGEPLGLSAVHGKGFDELLDAIVAAMGPVGEQELPEQPRYRVVILGKPNVGKSSLTNLLLKQERSIVADQPGTTREPVKERFRFHSEDIELTDTPGVRRKRGVQDPLEQMMVTGAMSALAEADIVLLMIDATEGALVDQELKLAHYAFDQKGKSLALLVNKWDLADEYAKERLASSLEEHEHFFAKVPRLNISCKTGENIGKVIPLVQAVWERATQQFGGAELTFFFQEALRYKPLYRSGSMLKIKYAKQRSVAPLTIELSVNMPRFWGPTQFGFLENRLRHEFDLSGVPIKFIIAGPGKK